MTRPTIRLAFSSPKALISISRAASMPPSAMNSCATHSSWNSSTTALAQGRRDAPHAGDLDAEDLDLVLSHVLEYLAGRLRAECDQEDGGLFAVGERLRAYCHGVKSFRKMMGEHKVRPYIAGPVGANLVFALPNGMRPSSGRVRPSRL